MLDFSGEGLSPTEVKTITDRVRTALVDYSCFEVVDKDKFERILEEQGQQLTGCFDDECVVEIGIAVINWP